VSLQAAAATEPRSPSRTPPERHLAHHNPGADDLVSGGERDQVREPGGGHEVAVVDELGDGGGEGGEFGHVRRSLLSLI